MNRTWIAGAATLAVMACSAMTVQAPAVHAQSTKPSMSDSMEGPEVEGRVRDVRGDQVTLSDGTELTVPKSQAKANELKPGAMIKATYQEPDGKKIVTSLRITEGSQTGGGATK